MKIIAFSGKKQSGKTTAVNYLLDNVSGSITVDFATALKNIACQCFGANPKYLFLGTNEDKEVLLPCGKSGREVLQLIGTDWFRSLDSDCWVRAYRAELEKIAIDYDSIAEGCFDDGLIVTADVRFPNEVKCVQDMGGHVIRLLRAPLEDEHESETALDDYSLNQDGIAVWNKVYNEGLQRCRTAPGFDAVIDNREMSVEEQNEAVWKLVNERGWL